MSSGIEVIVGLTLLGGLAGLTAGGIMCVFRGARDRGKQVVFYAIVLLGFSFSFFIFQGPSSGSGHGQNIDPAMAGANVESRPKSLSPPSYSEVLSQLRVTGFSFRKELFGTFMKVNFVIHNDSSIPVKDVVVTCSHSANSGTIIDSNTRTVYEIVGSRSYVSIVNMDMGLINSKAVDSSCKITAFKRV